MEDKPQPSIDENPIRAGDREQSLESLQEVMLGFSFFMITIGLMGVVLVIALDNYIIATALPKVTTQFKTLNLVGWYGSSYFLTLMAFQPAFGQLCTLFPIKPVFLISLLGFEIGSIITASAPNSVAFIIGRLMTGVFSGGLWCGVLTVVVSSVPSRYTHLYMSTVTTMYGVASAAGPLLGGIFTDIPILTWRFCFWINLPIGLFAFVVVSVFLKPLPRSALAISLTTKEKIQRLDFVGVILLLGAFASLFLALQWGGTTFAWSDSRVWGCLLGFALLILLWAVLQIRLKERATVPSHIVTQRTAGAGLCFTIFIALGTSIHIQYLPFYFQSVRGETARNSGIHILPYLMSLLVSPLITGSLISVVGYYIPFMYLGTVLFTIGSGLIATLGTDSSSAKWIGYQFLAAFGAGICRQIPFSSVPMRLKKEDIAIATALVAFCNSLGAMLGIVLGESIFTNVFSENIANIEGIDKVAVINGAATNLASLVPAPLLGLVRHLLDFAITRAFFLSIPCGGLAFCCSLVMEWMNVKH